MSLFVIMIIVAVAFCLSWFSAHSVGRFWTEAKVVGGWPRFMVITSLALCGLGFTGVYFMVVVIVASVFYPELRVVNDFLFPVSIGVLGAPGAGTVPNLWLNGQVMARRQQILGAVASGNPAIQLPFDPFDALDVASQSRGLWGWVGDLFKGGDSGGGDSDSGSFVLILIVIALIIFALFAGVVTTILIVQHADREHVGEILDMYRPIGA